MGKITDEPERYCAYCNKILYGRKDQRFCNDSCRNAFNSQKAKLEQQKIHENLPEIFRIIKRNYEILLEIGPLAKDEGVYWETGSPRDMGINPKFFTSIYINGDEIWKFCFERGWREFENGGWQIMDRREQAALN